MTSYKPYSKSKHPNKDKGHDNANKQKTHYNKIQVVNVVHCEDLYVWKSFSPLTVYVCVCVYSCACFGYISELYYIFCISRAVIVVVNAGYLYLK